MRVKAVRLGFYEHKRRKPGDVFTLKSEKDFSDSEKEHLPGWMKKLDVDDLDDEFDAKPKKVRKNQSVI